jgi:hypothetical protein
VAVVVVAVIDVGNAIVGLAVDLVSPVRHSLVSKSSSRTLQGRWI